MDFISNRQPQIEAMLATIGVNSIEELFSDVPKQLRLSPPDDDDGLSESEGMRLMEEIAAKNTFTHFDSYLGGGAYEHHVPALVGAVCSKSEFLTSYTPYQAEASQGMLQAIFEFQSAVCALTGMDVSNASVYDAANACSEAVLMALRCHPDRNKIVVARSLHPHANAVVEQAVSSHGTVIESIPFERDGTLDLSAVAHAVDDHTAAVLLQSPNFFGTIEDVAKVVAYAKKHNALVILCGNPLAYGIYASPAELGVDIAVGDTQPFGLPLQYGGPYVGYMACRQELIRQLPGRIVGETVDTQGRRGFVLTFQAREQHIRREKATSNICSNQALAALASLVAMLWYGKEGVSKLALTNYQRTSYLRDQLKKIPGVKVIGEAPWFNEFVVTFDCPLNKVFDHFRSYGIEPGVDFSRYYPELQNSLLIAVTEMKNKGQLDHYAFVAEKLVKGEKS